MACCYLPHFDLGWESPAAPCKSQHCWQPKSSAAHSLEKKICEKGAELSLPICFLFSLYLLLHLLSVRLCHKIHVRERRAEKDFSFPFPTSPSPKRRHFQVFEHFLKKGFSPTPGHPLLSLPFDLDELYGVKCPQQPSIPAPVQHCNVQRDAWWREKSAERERKGITGY